MNGSYVSAQSSFYLICSNKRKHVSHNMEWNNTAWRQHREYAILFATWMSLLTVIGTVGNMVILVKYPITGCSRGIGFLVKALAVVDMLNCLMIPHSILFELNLVQNLAVCKLMEYVRHVLVSISVVQLAFIAAEKYLLIRRPHVVVSRKRYAVATAVSVPIIAALNVPNIFLAKIDHHRTDETVKYFDMHVATCYMDNTGSTLGFVVGVYALTCFWGSVLIMFFAYGLASSASSTVPT